MKRELCQAGFAGGVSCAIRRVSLRKKNKGAPECAFTCHAGLNVESSPREWPTINDEALHRPSEETETMRGRLRHHHPRRSCWAMKSAKNLTIRCYYFRPRLRKTTASFLSCCAETPNERTARCWSSRYPRS